MKSVHKRILVGGSLAGSVALALWLNGRFVPGRVPWAVAAVLSLGGALEAARMERRRGGISLAALVVPGAVLAVLSGPAGAEFGWPPPSRGLSAWLAGLALAVFGAGAITLLNRAKGRGAAQRSAASASSALGTVGDAALLAAWILPPLYALVWLDARLGVGGLVLIVVLSKIGDVFGYFVGRQIGVRHPFPGISPNKTVAGCTASLVAGVVAGVAFAAAAYPTPWRAGLVGGAVLGLTVNLASQAGDLFESWVKRRAGVKDSSGLFGPSGGVLDVVDSLLFSLPLALVVLPTVV